MFGIRVLIYLLGIALVVWILFRLARSPRIETKPKKKVADMVSCARCGTYVPRDEAIQANDKFYCCDRHRNEDG